MISVTREQLEEARRQCERTADAGARYWCVAILLRCAPVFGEYDLDRSPLMLTLDFVRVRQVSLPRHRWVLQGSVRIVLTPDEKMDRASWNESCRWRFWTFRRRDGSLRNPVPHVAIYRELP